MDRHGRTLVASIGPQDGPVDQSNEAERGDSSARLSNSGNLAGVGKLYSYQRRHG